MSNSKPMPTLKIVSPVIKTTTKPGLVTSLPQSLPKNTKVVKKVESEDDMSDLSEDDPSNELEEGFYVELSLTSTNEDGEPEDKLVIFNFLTEESYVEHGENGYEDLEEQFEDSISNYYPGWTYAGEWEEHQVHGTELPEDNETPVVEVQ